MGICNLTGERTRISRTEILAQVVVCDISRQICVRIGGHDASVSVVPNVVQCSASLNTPDAIHHVLGKPTVDDCLSHSLQGSRSTRILS